MNLLPDICPTCGKKLSWKGVDLICDNELCEAQTFRKLEYFVKKIGVMGISITTLKKLGVDTIQGLYDLTVNDIKKLEGFGEKKSNAIVIELKDKLEMTQAKFLSSMGVSGLGDETAISILN